jgi:hypothetical protein
MPRRTNPLRRHGVLTAYNVAARKRWRLPKACARAYGWSPRNGQARIKLAQT